MKIALLFPNNIYTSPYLKYYTRILEEEDIAYDLIIWDRARAKEEGCIAFTSKNQEKSTLSKALNFFRFRKFIIQRLKKNKYSRLIIFSGQLGILLSDYLQKKYKNKYLLDIRDYSVSMSHFKGRFNKVVSNANLVCISSIGFKEWLPEGDHYILGHNINIGLIRDVLNNYPDNKTFFRNKTVNIDTIGQIKDFSSDKMFLDQLKNDDRFEMQFIGFGNTLNLLKEYVTEENVLNVSFYGKYRKEEEKELLKNTDFINILISRTEFNKGATLLSNRLYLSALYQIPCIVNSKTEQSRIIEKYNFGIVVDSYTELTNKVLQYKKEFDKKIFLSNCYIFLSDVKDDYDSFNFRVTNFLTNNNTNV